MGTRAADDFEFIRSRMEQLKRERQPARYSRHQRCLQPMGATNACGAGTALARGSCAECDLYALRRSVGGLRVHLRSLLEETGMTTTTFRTTFPAQPRICFEMRRLRIAMQCRRPAWY